MCGIAGYVTLDPRRVDVEDLRAMSAALAHRGPDDAGLHVESGVGLAHRRLAILDLSSAGHQPMQGPDGNWVTYNGEIYNFKELAAELRGHQLETRTRCDTEVLLLGIQAYGLTAALKRFNGMFAFGHWDGRQKQMTLVRDRLGVKPLYYYADQSCLVFASELRALQRWRGCPSEVDPEALDLFLAYEHVPSPMTILAGVRKLEPGSWLRWRDGIWQTERWWNVAFDEPTTPRPDAEWVGECRELLRDATRLRLISDAPLGALLSGGVDSSSVVAMMASLGHAPKTFSIGFRDATYDEAEFARAVAIHTGSEHYADTLEARPDRALEIIDVAMDEPLGDVSLIPTYLVSAMARRHVTVVLSGDGGDEVFAGYDWYRAAELADRYQLLPSRIRAVAAAALASVHPRPEKKGLVNKAKRFTEGAAADPRLEHLRWQLFANPASRRRLLQPELRHIADAARAEAIGVDRLEKAAATRPLSRRQWVDLALYLPDDILTKVDRASMAVALEVRSPFLDYRVVELAARMPTHLRVAGGQRKLVLKRAMAGMVPRNVLDRPKQGFSIPMKNWLRRELRPQMLDSLGSATARTWFDSTEIKRLVAEHDEGRANHSHVLWCAMTFVRWCDRGRSARQDLTA